ncbi:MAG: DUF1512 domain-containing protein [Nitrososphaeria archaeon]|nr:DUF1512 domain-containing protein [Nitrososphaeria archaeon]NDB51298.1 DUF1512 domain-containing protein [Nitrosopumilaceae archaeon]NDB90003.1 DUF1512 domain-containing protein [Nitrososphaerota archaeon]NDB46744.1 DUF1512 domain-containing protein [Nitrososphaeria archaeon]NDB92227.1 DUF1512 domain-containing protein [Nitrososphaeria archaeon]
MNYTDIFSADKMFGGNSDSSNPIMWIIWIVPIVIFVFYGQRIQLMVTSGEINKSIEKLQKYKDETRKELLDYLQKSKASGDVSKKVDRFLEYFTIMPVDIDPNGIMPKIKHLLRSREDYTRNQVRLLAENITPLEASKIQNLLEVVTSLNLLHKIVRHLFLTAKRQNNFPLILPLQMMLPFIMEQADALKGAVSALKAGQPIGDGIGPMVVGKMMLKSEKKQIGLDTVYAESDFEGRKLCLLKAEGPSATVGRPGDAVEILVAEKNPQTIIMVDAGLKLEGETSGTVAQGFGAAIGGIGTDRFQIEEVATKHNIPVYAIVIKQSIKEAITLMTKEIADKAEEVESQIYDTIRENTTPGQSVIVVGVGNTLGVPQ